MKKRLLGVVLVCGLGIAFAGCGGDTGGKPGAKLDGAAEAGTDVAVGTSIMPLPVLDPSGTYGGKTYAEWAGEWGKWIYEYPGPESLAFNTPGAYCGMGQSTAPGDGGTDGQPFFLGIWDSNDLASVTHKAPHSVHPSPDSEYGCCFSNEVQDRRSIFTPPGSDVAAEQAVAIPPQRHRVESKRRLGGGLAAERQNVRQTAVILSSSRSLSHRSTGSPRCLR